MGFLGVNDGFVSLCDAGLSEGLGRLCSASWVKLLRFPAAAIAASPGGDRAYFTDNRRASYSLRPLLFFYRSDEQLRFVVVRCLGGFQCDNRLFLILKYFLKNIVMLNNLFIVNTEDIYQR